VALYTWAHPVFVKDFRFGGFLYPLTILLFRFP